ncbi:MAG: winged helix-turn-helix transcriptional regulator [Thermoleophilia bacterium]|nr:winged helix-turn-helix transcriptional regulator [Thermoleophilia bacterium]
MVKYRTLDGTFGALANPTRRQIILRLRDGEASVGELAAPHRMSLPAISRHISVLEDAGLVFRRKEGRQQYCRLATSPLNEIDAWLRRFRDVPEMATEETKKGTR